jgi:ATP-binding cassette subfamily B protein
MKVFAGLYPTLQGLSANVNRVIELLDSSPEVAEKSNAVEMSKVRGEIRFEQVTTGYEVGRAVLKGITLMPNPVK